MKIKTIWYARSFPHHLEFYGENENGKKIDIYGNNELKNQNSAPSPKELVLQGMASCTSVDIVNQLREIKQPLQSLTVECEAEQTESDPKVFKNCFMTYFVSGENISAEKVAHCIQLSLTKYCGVSNIIENSGCYIYPKLYVNDKLVDIWDPESILSNKFENWLNSAVKKAPNGIALVTGSSRGIGASLTKQLVKQGYAVIATSRTNYNFENEFIFDSCNLDVTKKMSILNLKNLLKKHDVSLNLLIHNAGIASEKGGISNLTSLELNFAEMRHIYETNVFGLIETNNSLIEFMNKGSTILLVSSLMGHKSMDYYSAATYRMSKRTVTQYGMQVAMQLKSENKEIAILSLHPGSVLTDMNPQGRITVEKSAEQICLLISHEYYKKIIKQNGSFWSYDEFKKSWQCMD